MPLIVDLIFKIFLKNCLFINFWLHWDLVVACRLSLVGVPGDYVFVVCGLTAMASHCGAWALESAGFSHCGAWV